MRKMHREPEVLEAEAQVEECLDCLARITSKELAPLHSVKSGTIQNACSTRRRVVADLWKSALMRIARLMNSLAKVQKRMVTKGSGRVENYTTIGLRFSRYGAAEVYNDFAEELRHAETDPTCKIHMKPLHVTFETMRILRSDRFAQVNLISVAPTLQNLRIGLRRRQSGKSDVPVKQRGNWPKISMN